MLGPQPSERDRWTQGRAPMRLPILATSLCFLRIFRGISQDELAQRSGLRPAALSTYEHGHVVPGLETLLKIAGGLDFPLSALERCEEFQRDLVALTLPERPGEADRYEEIAVDDRAQWRTLRQRGELRAEIEALAFDMGRVAVRFVRLFFLLLARLDVGLRSPSEDSGASE